MPSLRFLFPALTVFLQLASLGGLLACLTLLLPACVTPTQRFDTQAAQLNLHKRRVPGKGFDHIAYFQPKPQHSERLHIYLEGDGTPWVRRRRIARDPTPRTPLTLRLMVQDPVSSVYLGRPCYHGLAQEPSCSAWDWTQGRYSPQVIASLSAALNKIKANQGDKEIVLIGYSGGGTLAMLLAERLEAVRAVVTIAGNLDTEAWTAYHNYSPLRGSLNPADRPPLHPRIRQFHLVGEEDRNVPSRFTVSVVAQQRAAKLYRFESFDHRCCWKAVWPSMLDRLKAALKPSTHGIHE